MRQGICLLDKALDIAHKEMTALENGEYEKAEKLAEKRGEIISRAWGMLENDPSGHYRERLVSLSRMQEYLTSMAMSAQKVVVESLQKSRQEKRRMRGYHLSVGQALQ